MTHVAPAALLPRLPLGKLCWMPWLTYGLSGGLEGGQAVVATPQRGRLWWLVCWGSRGVAASFSCHLGIVVQGE